VFLAMREWEISDLFIDFYKTYNFDRSLVDIGHLALVSVMKESPLSILEEIMSIEGGFVKSDDLLQAVEEAIKKQYWNYVTILVEYTLTHMDEYVLSLHL